MFFLFALFLFIFSSPPKPVHASSGNSIPLFYQLIEAYKPAKTTPSNSLTILNPEPAVTINTSPIIASAGPNIGGGESGELITIAVLGDSMIDTLGPNIPQLQKALVHYYPNKKIKILNYGAAATTIEYALFRLTNNYQYLNKNVPSLISQSPDVVIIESFAYNNFGNTQSGFDKQSGFITNIISKIHDQLPKTNLLLTSTFAPNSLIFANSPSEIKFNALEKIERTTTIKNYLQNFINYAKDHHIPYADAYHPSLIKNEGNRNFINYKDNIHPSIYGGEFFCDTLAKALFDNHLIP